jgi:hypothetical protein
MADREKRRLMATEFEAHTAATDQLAEADLDTAVLGLVGEIGSLVSALKKSGAILTDSSDITRPSSRSSATYFGMSRQSLGAAEPRSPR